MIECIHVSFAEDKRAYTLYSMKIDDFLNESDVKFEEENRERVNMDADSGEEEYETKVDNDDGNPEGEKATEGCQNPGSHINSMQSGPKLPPEPTNLAPKPHPTCAHKGIPPICSGEDPKLEMGSTTSKSKAPRPTKETHQAEGLTPGGASAGNSAETGPSHQVINDTIRSLFLTADAPHSY